MEWVERGPSIAIEELRLHGMSGTPPRELLYTDPVTYDRSESTTKVWEVHRDNRDRGVQVRAFHWGNLTSGSKLTAFWILLTPFVFANVAGWMQQRNDDTLPSRWQVGLIRSANLGLTGLFVSQLAVVFVGLAHTLAFAGVAHRWVVGAGGIALGLSFLGIVWVLSTKSHITTIGWADQASLTFGTRRLDLLPPDKRNGNNQGQWGDPAPGARLTTPEMWETQGVLHRLRRLHLSFGLLVTALVLDLGVRDGVWRSWLICALLTICFLAALASPFGRANPKDGLSWAVDAIARFGTPLAAGVWIGEVGLVTSSVAIPGAILLALIVGLAIAARLIDERGPAEPGAGRFLVPLVLFAIGTGVALIDGGSLPVTRTWPLVHHVVLAQALITGVSIFGYLVVSILRGPAGNGADRLMERLASWAKHVRGALMPAGAMALAMFIGASLGIAVAVSAEYAATNILAEESPFANTSLIEFEELNGIQRVLLSEDGIDMVGYTDLRDEASEPPLNSEDLCTPTGETCLQPEIRWQLSRFDISKTEVVLNGGNWIAIAMLGFILGIVAVAGFMMWRGDELQDEGRWMSILRRITSRSDRLFAWIGLLGSVLGGLAVVDLLGTTPILDPQALSRGLEASILKLVVGALAITAVLALSAGLALFNAAVASAILIVGGGTVLLVLKPDAHLWLDIPLIGLPVDLLRSEHISILLMALVPAILILRSIIGGIGDPDSRRRVGMLWDTGSFWPRWYHPLGPTAYGPSVVESLQKELVTDPPDILAAHSQGSVIATVTMYRTAIEPRGFLTYGSPLGILYSRVFPSTGVEDLAKAVQRKMSRTDEGITKGHWINLWRDTDPLGGGPIPGLRHNVGVELAADFEEGSGHSQYELTKTYRRARNNVLLGLPLSEDPELDDS